jgi:hypothetical protein
VDGAMTLMRCLLIAAVALVSTIAHIQCVQFRIIGVAFAVVALNQNRTFISMTVSTKSQVNPCPSSSGKKISPS